MITVTGQLQKDAWARKAFPPVEPVRDGVWSIPVVFQDNPMRYTLAYLLVGDDEAVLVDPGWDSDEGWQQLVTGMLQAGISVRELTGIVVTHHHIDHLGMATRLRDASGAWVAMGTDERQLDPRDELRALSLGDSDRAVLWGVPAERRDEVTIKADTEAAISLASPDLRLADGQLLPVAGLRVRVVATPGHTVEHVCLVDEANGLILSGDHVLPRISPHISLETNGLPDPLASYYRSLEAIAINDDMEVLPAHEYRFIGMQRRVVELLEHNRGRSAEVRRVLDTEHPTTVWDVARNLTWSRGWDSLNGFSLRLALSETASHLVYLRNQGLDMSIPVAAGVVLDPAPTQA